MSYESTICPTIRARTQSTPTSDEPEQMLRGFAAHAHLDLSGRVLQESLHPSGQGAYCDVYKGLSLAHGKYVAIKRFREYVVGGLSDKFTNGLARELEIWAKLRHPNVLPLLGFVIDDAKYPALVSEWMPNGTVLQYCIAYSSACILTLVKGIAAGLFYLHSKGVVHSDMKSDNVLVTASGVPQLADFGVSRLFVQTGTVNSTSNLKGSVRWTSVELLRGEANAQELLADTHKKESKRLVSLQADVWAFGMTIYELLAKDRPYHHLPGDFQVFFAIIRGDLPSVPLRVEQGIAEIDEKTLWALCKRCWSTKPEDRPTMMDVTFELSCGFRMTGRCRSRSKTRRDSEQSDQMFDGNSNSVNLGNKPGKQAVFPSTSKKARTLDIESEDEARRQSQSQLFTRRPVQMYQQKVASETAKPSLLSQKLRQEALRAHRPPELTPQQRISVADVFAPTAADWAWRKRPRKSTAAESVVTLLSINFHSDVRAGSPSDEPEESDEAAGPQRSQSMRALDDSAKDSPRSSKTFEAKLSLLLSRKKEGGDLPSQSSALKTLAALHEWAKSRHGRGEADVKDGERRRQETLQPPVHRHTVPESPDSVLITQQLELPPAIAPITVQKVRGFVMDGSGANV